MTRHAWPLVCILCLIVISQFSARADASSRQDVEFMSEGVSLRGTLFFPDAKASTTALVLLHGSAKKDSLRMNALARALASDGFAVLTYDKRGVGQSAGVFQRGNHEAELTLLARDAVAAVDVVAKSPKLRGASIGLLGISQGGWVGPIAATRSEQVAFVLLWSGPVCTLSEEVHFSTFAKNIPNFSMHEYSSEVREHMRAVPKLASDFDPIPVLQNASVPMLWVFGARDNSIPVELSIERLDRLIKGGKSNFEYRLLPDGEHELNYLDQATLDWMRKQAARRSGALD